MVTILLLAVLVVVVFLYSLLQHTQVVCQPLEPLLLHLQECRHMAVVLCVATRYWWGI